MTTADERTGWIPSHRALWILVGVIAVSGIASGFLERGLGGEPLAEFDHLATDVAAFYELADRGVDPCPTLGDPVVPSDLAGRLAVTCKPYDTEGGFLFALALLGIAVLGVVIVIASGNRFGVYLVLLIAVMMVGSGFGETYAVRALLIEPGSLPFGEVVMFLVAPSWVIGGVLLVPRLILVFPTGRLPSPRWRWVTRATYVPAALLIISMWLQPFGGHDYPNPLPFRVSSDLSFGLFDIGIIAWFGVLNVAFAGLLWRFVTARGDERQQLKWVAYAVAIGLVVNLIAAIGPFEGTVQQITNFGVLPVVVLFSIFKFRLYDIDRIINRTVVYGLVTALTAGLFLAIIIIPQSFLFVWGQDLDNNFVMIVVVATLVVAAAFNPLRRRVQQAVDRRFDRSRYDAEQVVSDFRDRLAELRHLPSLVDDLSDVVTRTVAPRQVGVWTPGDES